MVKRAAYWTNHAYISRSPFETLQLAAYALRSEGIPETEAMEWLWPHVQALCPLLGREKARRGLGL